MAISVSKILKAAKIDKLELYRGEGYWYFDHPIWAESKSVYTPRLSDLGINQWVEIATEVHRQYLTHGASVAQRLADELFSRMEPTT